MPHKILIAGDCHFPAASNDALAKLYSLARILKPTIIVQIGDLYDLFSHGRFPRSHNIMTPAKEIEQGYEDASRFWKQLQKASPKAKCFQLIGNHDERPKKMVIRVAPELESLMNFKQIFDFPSVEVSDSERDELIIDQILFMHGFRSKLGDHVRNNLMSTVVGHSHHGGVYYQRLGNKTLYELNCGFLGNANAPALSYTRQRKISNWTLGAGLITELGPQFVAF